MHISTGVGGTRARTVVVSAALVALAASALNAEPSIAAGPTKLLQSVTVGLSTDGSITSVDLANIAKDGGALKSQNFDLDPSKVASGLPVSVAVSYLKDGKPGTDLAQLAGATGLVELDVTVTNTTQKAQEIHYQSGGVDHTAWALVGTPLTVVGSATLPKDSFAGIVQTPAGVPTAHTTNGVVSQPKDGDSSVQWAAMLAPPRLAGSTTFRLVVDATKFSLPSFTFSVRPGLLTDPSVASVLDAAFGTQGSLASVQNTTIGLISDVTASMAQATDSLQVIRDDLRTNAQAVGNAATSTLRQTGEDLNAAADSLLSDLRSLQSSLSGSLASASDASSQALRTSLQTLIDEFGVTAGSGNPVAAPAGPATCGAAVPTQTGAPSLMGQLRAVAGQVKSLSSATGTCVTTLQKSLDSTIGSTDQPCSTTGTPTLVCRLTDASATLTTVAGDLAQRGTKILGEFDTEAAGDAGTRLGTLTSAIRDLQTQATGLTGTGGENTALDATLTGLGATLTGLKTALATAITSTTSTRTGLIGDLAALHTQAEQQITALGSTGAAQTRLAALATAACAAVPPLPVDASGTADQAYLDQVQAYADKVKKLADDVHAAAVGGDCTATAGTTDATTVAASIRTAAAAWTTIATSTDGDSSSGAVAKLQALATSLQAAATDVDTALTALGSGKDTALTTALTKLSTDLAAVYDPTDAPATSCPAKKSDTTTKPLNAARNSFAELDCNRATVGSDLAALLQANQPEYTKAAQDVKDAASSTNDARKSADGQLGTLMGNLVGQLNGTADQQVRDGAAELGAQQSALQAEQAKALQQLDSTTKQALGALAAGVTASTSQQGAANQVLQSELTKVLTDLGSAQIGTGLLGDIQAKAGETDVRATQVANAAEVATGYRGVRTADLNAQILSQEQFSRAMQQVQAFPAFATTLPPRSTSSTVFVFTLPRI